MSHRDLEAAEKLLTSKWGEIRAYGDEIARLAQALTAVIDDSWSDIEQEVLNIIPRSSSNLVICFELTPQPMTMDYLGQFMHDVQSVLFVLVGAAEFLKESSTKQEIHSDLATLEELSKQALQMKAILRQISDTSWGKNSTA